MSSTVQNRTFMQETWALATPYVVPPTAAALAIVPSFYGFAAKSALQTGNPLPKMSIIQCLKEGAKAAPTIGVIVGSQMLAQKAVETAFNNLWEKPKEDKADFKTMIASAAIVGAATSPCLAVFNGQTMGKSMKESLHGLTKKQVAAITTRETSFLFGLRFSDPLSEKMKISFGQSRSIEYASAFTSGAVASLFGHPADTALTLWQKGLKAENLTAYMRGAPVRAVAAGTFTMCYKSISEMINTLSK